jgi:hypothetical protein
MAFFWAAQVVEIASVVTKALEAHEELENSAR